MSSENQKLTEEPQQILFLPSDSKKMLRPNRPSPLSLLHSNQALTLKKKNQNSNGPNELGSSPEKETLSPYSKRNTMKEPAKTGKDANLSP